MALTNLAYKTHYTRGADLAAASTLPLILDGDYFHVTGTTTITRLANIGKGMQIVLRFASALTIQHDATYLITTSGSDYTVAAGQQVRFVQYDDDGKWRMLDSIGGSNQTGDFSSIKSSASLGWRVDNNGDFTTDLSDWTAGAGWAWTAADAGSAEHTTGNTATLAGTADVLEDTRYYGEFTISNRTGGSVTVSIDGDLVYNASTDTQVFGIDGTYTFGFAADADGTVNIVITPNTFFDGRITSVKVYTIDPASPAVIIRDDTGFEACDIMADDDLDNLFMGEDSGLYAYTGDRNICYGKNSGESIVVGSNNAFFGKDSGEDCTSGHYNVGIGADAVSKMTTGSCNTAIGSSSGTAITQGSRNTLIGYMSGYSMTTGLDNTFIGPKAGELLTTGVSNVCIGPKAGQEITGDLNIFIGERAGRDAGSGDKNIGIGYETFVSASTGENNIGMGYRAGWYLSTGGYNILLGTESGYDINTGSRNVGVGYRSLYNATSPDKNIAIGDEAAYTLTTGTENICIGDKAGYGIVDDSYNICIGVEAGESLSVGDYNILIGRYACENGTGESNIIIGDEARRNGTGSGNENVVIGDSAAKDLTTGSNNVVVGNHAADNLLATDGNVIIGNNAAIDDGEGTPTDNTSSVNCVFIGNNVETYGSADSNNIAIGYDARPYATENTVVIGNYDIERTRLFGTLSLPGGQIAFPSDVLASTDANTLDDYEEGTFTPTLTLGGGNTGMTYNVNDGWYTKIGNLVNIQLSIELTAKGSSTGNVLISGLPFTNQTGGSSAAETPLAVYTYSFINAGDLYAFVVENDDTIKLYYRTFSSTTTTQVTSSSIANTTKISLQGSYRID